jgi:hypothetical protein
MDDLADLSGTIIPTMLVGVPFFKIRTPAFLDHALKAHAVWTRYCTIDQFKEICADSVVYLYTIHQAPGQPKNVYAFRYAAIKQKGVAPLVVNPVFGRVIIDEQTLEPTREFSATIDTYNMERLRVMWGQEEAAKQIGEQIITAFDNLSKVNHSQ